MITPQVFKTQRNGKTIYTFNGQVARNSKRDYKYALVGQPRKALGATGDGDWQVIGFGNNAQNLVNSWKSIKWHCELKVLEIETPKTYFFTLLDETLEPIEDFCPENGSDIVKVRLQAIEYMKAHDMPVATLTMDDPMTFFPNAEPIDIIL
jgi:hypothetical protein